MKSKPKTKATPPRCGLCGKTENLVQTPCCGNWICNDEAKYVLFSYARTSCSRNHRRYTLCGYHHAEQHSGHWKDCKACRESFQTELFVWFGTNEYNFEKLENPPHFEPTVCDRCGRVIRLGTDGYSLGPDGTLCERCSVLDLPPPDPPKRRPRRKKGKS